ncbi:MAG: hypothetical protein WC052_02695 [Patescibacteria group bacterium]|jgi:uncharacterized repeat protein (TIGR01451 family)
MNNKQQRKDYAELEALYESPTDFQVPKHVSRWRRFAIGLIVLAVAASAAAWLGFAVFDVFSPSKSGAVSIEIVAPSDAAVGSTVTYRFQVANNATESAKNIKLRVNYPQGFSWQSATLSPENEVHNTWVLPALAPGEKKEVAVDGTLFGETGSLVTVFATVTYEFPNLPTQLQASDSVSTALTSGAIALTVAGTTQVVPGDEKEYVVTVQNNGAEPLQALQLVVQQPENLAITEAEPAVAEAGSWQWVTPVLSPGQSFAVTLKTKWSSEAAGEQVIRASLTAVGSASQAAAVASSELRVGVINGDVLLTLTANGNSNSTAASFGDSLRYVLRYQNLGAETINGITVSVRYDGGNLIRWDGVRAEGATVESGTITWRSENTPALQRLLSEGSGEFSWDVPVIAKSNSVSGAGQIVATPTFAFSSRGDASEAGKIDGSPMVVAINTSVNVRVSARYFSPSGEPIGSGPLPPVVGEETSYRIIWQLTGSTHSLRDVVVTGNLPSYVTAETGTATTGTLKVTGTTAVWKIDALPPGLEPQAFFTVRIKPTSSDSGRILVLSGQTTLAAHDETTNGAVKVTGTTATTSLDGDQIAAGKGIVTTE